MQLIYFTSKDYRLKSESANHDRFTRCLRQEIYENGTLPFVCLAGIVKERRKKRRRKKKKKEKEKERGGGGGEIRGG